MPKKIPMSEKNKWLESFDDGIPASEIAKKEHRALKVIKRGVEEARAERDGAAARAEIVKDALIKHQKQLMGIIERLLETVDNSPAELELRREKNGALAPIPLPAGRITYTTEKGLTVELSDETTTLWGLLKEHLSTRDRIWSAIKNWKVTMVNFTQARTNLELGIRMLVEIETVYKVKEKKSTENEEDHIYPFVVQHFFKIHNRKALGISDETNPQDNIFIGDDGYLRNGRGGPELAYCPGKQQECQEALIRAYNKIPNLPETRKLIAADQELNKVSGKLKRMLEDIHLMGLIPGRCRICSRISL